MSKKLDEIVGSTVAQRLEFRDNFFAIGEDLKEIKEISTELVKSKDYTRQHPPGPIEVEFDIEKFQEVMTSIAESETEDIDNLKESVTEDLYNLGKSITEDIDNLAESITEDIDNLAESVSEDIWGSTYVLSSLIEKGFEVTQEQLGDIQCSMDYLCGGIDEIIENQEAQYELMEKGFTQLAERTYLLTLEQRKTSNILTQGFSQINEGIATLDVHEQERHKALVQEMREISQSEYARHAEERWRIAYELYSIKDYSSALKGVKQALKEKTTHTPSLFLFAELCRIYGRWSDAKNTFHKISKLEEKRGNQREFEEAIEGLINLEVLVGNFTQAINLAYEKSCEDFGKEKRANLELTKVYTRLEYTRLRKEGGKEAEDFLFELLNLNCPNYPELWEEIYMHPKVYGEKYFLEEIIENPHLTPKERSSHLSKDGKAFGPLRRLFEMNHKWANLDSSLLKIDCSAEYEINFEAMKIRDSNILREENSALYQESHSRSTHLNNLIKEYEAINTEQPPIVEELISGKIDLMEFKGAHIFWNNIGKRYSGRAPYISNEFIENSTKKEYCQALREAHYRRVVELWEEINFKTQEFHKEDSITSQRISENEEKIRKLNSPEYKARKLRNLPLLFKEPFKELFEDYLRSVRNPYEQTLIKVASKNGQKLRANRNLIAELLEAQKEYSTLDTLFEEFTTYPESLLDEDPRFNFQEKVKDSIHILMESLTKSYEYAPELRQGL